MNSIPVLGTEPASENRMRSCCGSAPGIRFYCKPVTLVLCREIRGEIRFSGRVGGKLLCEMTSAFIIKELRGARALRLFCGRSAFPPPSTRARMISGPFFSPAIPAPRGVPAIRAAGAGLPGRSTSATSRARAVSFLCLACGWAQRLASQNQRLSRGGSPSTVETGQPSNGTGGILVLAQ